MKVWDEGISFKDAVLADPDITQHIDSADVELVFESERLIQNVGRVFERVFGKS